MFTTFLPVCQACLHDGDKIPVRYAIRNFAQRASRVAVAAQRKAKCDAQRIAPRDVDDEQPQSVQEEVRHHQDIQQPPEEIETIASIHARRGRARGNNTSLGRGGRGRGKMRPS